MLNFQWPVWESESDNTKFNTPATHPQKKKKKSNYFAKILIFLYKSLLDFFTQNNHFYSISTWISTSVIWWALTQITWSPLYEWMKETHGFIYHTHSEARVTLAVTSASAISLNEDIHEQHLLNCSESHFMSILPFDLSKNSIISYTPRTVNVFTATRQNKSLVKLGRQYGRNMLIFFSRMYILLLLGYY